MRTEFRLGKKQQLKCQKWFDTQKKGVTNKSQSVLKIDYSNHIKYFLIILIIKCLKNDIKDVILDAS